MPSDPATARAPAAVVVAAVVVAAQGLALLLFGGWQLLRRAREAPSNEAVFQGSTVFLLLLGALVVVVAVGVLQRRRWALGAVVFLQLLALGVVFEMVSAGFWVGALPLGIAAVVALLAVFSPAGRATLGR